MDLSKAFDSIPHGLMLAKLNAYGLSTHACNFLKSYLCDRKQCVKLSTYRSEWKILERGVPQGSVAGPLLFNIFINDIFLFLTDSCDIYNYADDNSIACHNKDVDIVRHRLESAAGIALKWFKQNHMQANADKFQSILFHRSKCIPNYVFNVNNVSIPTESSVKLLGVLLDNKLNFESHVSTICKKAAAQVKALMRLPDVLSTSCRKRIYEAFISSHFNYCSLVWHFCGKKSTRKV